MKRFGGTQVYRWTFHECPRQIHYWYSGIPASGPSAFQQLLFQRGREYEERYLKLVAERVTSYVDIRRTRWIARVEATIDAMRDGIEFIAHPSFEPKDRFEVKSLDVQFMGEADGLRRVSEKPLASGLYEYEVVEIKSSGRVLEHYIAQAAYYSMLVESTQGRTPENATIITWERTEEGEREPVENVVNLGDARARLTRFIQGELGEHALDPNADYHLRSTCDSCPYRKRCEEQATAEQHLSVLPGIRRRQRQDLIEAGVRTWPELAVGWDEYAELEDRWAGNAYVLRNLRTQAMALKYDASFGIGRLEGHLGLVAESGSEVRRAAGSRTFAGARVYFDLETDPLDDLVYLFGYQVEAVKRTTGPTEDFRDTLEAFCSTWGALQAPVQLMASGLGEKALFEIFLDATDELRALYGRLRIFHYGRFERTQLASLAQKHPSVENVDARVRRLIGESVDLHAALVNTRCLPLASYSLKSVAPCLHRLTDGVHGHAWEGPRDRPGLWRFLLNRGMSRKEAGRNLGAVERAAKRWKLTLEEIIAPSAGTSVLWFRENVDEPAPVWLALIEAYNADDLLAARAVAHWLMEEYWAEEDSGTSPQVSGLQVAR